MTTLKCLQEHRHNTEPTQPLTSEKRSIKKDDDLIDLFPLPRYFQVHFEHIHDSTHDVQGKLTHLTHDIQSQLDHLKETLAKVEGKLDRLNELLVHPTDPGL